MFIPGLRQSLRQAELRATKRSKAASGCQAKLFDMRAMCAAVEHRMELRVPGLVCLLGAKPHKPRGFLMSFLESPPFRDGHSLGRQACADPFQLGHSLEHGCEVLRRDDLHDRTAIRTPFSKPHGA